MKLAVTPSLPLQDSPDFVTLPLPSWLMHNMMQSLNAYGLASEHIRSTLQPVLAVSSSLCASLQIMDNAVNTQERLLAKLRMFSNLHRAQLTPEIRPVSLAHIAAQLSSNPALNPPGKECHWIGFKGLRIMSNESRLIDLLTCLCENAVSHARSSIRVIAQECSQGVQIDVVDDGPGLPQEVLEALGRPFIRQTLSQPLVRPGLGLGIHIAAATAALLGHKLEVANLQGEGCYFSLTADVASDSSVMDQNEADPLLGAHVLIIDSNAQSTELLRKLILSWLCLVDAAPQWDSVLPDKAASGDFDILVLGFDTWLQSGANILSAIRSRQSAPPYSIVLVDDINWQHAELTTAQRNPRFQALYRPLSPTKLRSALNNAMLSRA